MGTDQDKLMTDFSAMSVCFYQERNDENAICDTGPGALQCRLEKAPFRVSASPTLPPGVKAEV